MADTIIQGLAPNGGARLVLLSPNGANQLTPIRVDPECRVLVIDVPVLAGQARVRLQWIGEEGDAFAAAIARPLPEGEDLIDRISGWPAKGPVFYLAAPINTPVFITAKRG